MKAGLFYTSGNLNYYYLQQFQTRNRVCGLGHKRQISLICHVTSTETDPDAHEGFSTWHVNPLRLQLKLSLLTTCTFPTQASKRTSGILRSVSARPLGEYPPSSLQLTPRTRGRAPAGVTQTPRDLPGHQRQDEGAQSHLPGALYIHTIVPEQGGSPCPHPSSLSLHMGTFEAPVSSSRAAVCPDPCLAE